MASHRAHLSPPWSWQMVLAVDIRRLRHAYPAASFLVHVDDVSCQLQHKDPVALAKEMVCIAADVLHNIEREVGLIFSLQKSKLLSTSNKTARLMTKAMGGYQWQHEVSVRKLGFDYSFDRQNGLGQVFKARLKVANNKLVKIGQGLSSRAHGSSNIWGGDVGRSHGLQKANENTSAQKHGSLCGKGPPLHQLGPWCQKPWTP